MELDKFLKLILDRGLIIGKEINNMKLETYRGLAELTKYINYGCKFDKYGRCSNFNAPAPKEQSMCCCGGCFYNIGYIRVFPTGDYWISDKQDKLKDLRVYAQNFSEKEVSNRQKQGYWRADKGCILPRSYRSITCLGYSCNKNKNAGTGWEKALMNLLQGVRAWPVGFNKREYHEHDVVRGMIDWRKQLNKKEKKHG